MGLSLSFRFGLRIRKCRRRQSHHQRHMNWRNPLPLLKKVLRKHRQKKQEMRPLSNCQEAPQIVIAPLAGDGAHDVLLRLFNMDAVPSTTEAALIDRLGLPEDANAIDIVRALSVQTGMLDAYAIDEATSQVGTNEIVLPLEARLSIDADGDIIYSDPTLGTRPLTEGGGTHILRYDDWPTRFVPEAR